MFKQAVLALITVFASHSALAVTFGQLKPGDLLTGLDKKGAPCEVAITAREDKSTIKADLYFEFNGKPKYFENIEFRVPYAIPVGAFFFEAMLNLENSKSPIDLDQPNVAELSRTWVSKRMHLTIRHPLRSFLEVDGPRIECKNLKLHSAR